MARGKFAHLSGTDQVNRFAVEIAEDFLCQIDRNRRDRYRGRCDGSLATNLLGDGKGAGQECIQLGLYGSDGAGDSVCLFDLAENLGLADNHRVKARSHAKEMVDGGLLAMFEKVLLKIIRLEAVVLADELAEIAFAIRSAGNDLDAVAGGNDHSFFDTGNRRELA